MFGTKLGRIRYRNGFIFCVLKQLKGFCKLLKCAKSGRMKVPFGIAQTGKAFRNEIVARQFIFHA
jgi:glycyl-tRNA synthetase